MDGITANKLYNEAARNMVDSMGINRYFPKMLAIHKIKCQPYFGEYEHYQRLGDDKIRIRSKWMG